MAAMNASTMVVLGGAQVAISSNGFASKNSVSFSSGRVPSMAFVRARSVRPLSVRAGVSDDKPDMPSSTGGITEKAQQVADKTAAVLDGVKEDVEGMLKDEGRDLKSKTGDVKYGAQRNAAGGGSDTKGKE
ncbi:unnamed protein product [Calypogeia fissa]